RRYTEPASLPPLAPARRSARRTCSSARTVSSARSIVSRLVLVPSTRRARSIFRLRRLSRVVMRQATVVLPTEARPGANEGLLADGRLFLGGERPSIADFSAYHPLSMLRQPPLRTVTPLEQRSPCLGRELGRLHPNQPVARSRDAVAMIPDEVGKATGMWPGPRCRRHRPGCGLRGSRLDDLAAERRRLGTPERRVDAAAKRGRMVHSWNAEFAESEEVDDGLRKARVRVPLRLDALLHPAAEHDQGNAGASDHLEALRVERIRYRLGV